jgi:hypothetical protein
MADFAHYVKREIVEVDYQSPDAAWFAEHHPDDQGFVTPTYHVTRAKTGPATRVSKGDTLWLFSQLRAPWGELPPALDAKIIVAEVTDYRECHRRTEAAFRFAADEGSSWFPLYDARDTLMALETKTPSRPGVRKLLARWDQPLGTTLQSMRELADSTPLVDLERKLAVRGFDFVSYRLLDGTRAAFEEVRQLLQAGHAIWWDRWSLPRRLAERREFLDDPALDKFIRERIELSGTVFGIVSPKYAEHPKPTHGKRRILRKDSESCWRDRWPRSRRS